MTLEQSKIVDEKENEKKFSERTGGNTMASLFCLPKLLEKNYFDCTQCKAKSANEFKSKFTAC